MKKILYILLIILFSLSSCVQYEIKNDGVYYNYWNEASGSLSRRLPDADRNTFETLKDKLYGKDKNFVFYKGRKIAGADPFSFKLIGDLYATDKLRAFYAGDSIATSSSTEFEIINNYYSKDYKNVYYTTKPLNVCSVNDFKFIYNDESENGWNRWSTDGCFFYMRNFKTPSNEYQKVKIFKGSAGIAMDSKYVYYFDRNIYFDQEGKRILDTIDIATFQVTGFIRCKDKYGCINVYHGRKNCK